MGDALMAVVPVSPNTIPLILLPIGLGPDANTLPVTRNKLPALITVVPLYVLLAFDKVNEAEPILRSDRVVALPVLMVPA